MSAPFTYFAKVFALFLESNILIVSDGLGVTMPPGLDIFNVPKNLCGCFDPSDFMVI